MLRRKFRVPQRPLRMLRDRRSFAYRRKFCSNKRLTPEPTDEERSFQRPPRQARAASAAEVQRMAKSRK
eukprot:1281721-Pleurochrysis_carterae.AAC.1